MDRDARAPARPPFSTRKPGPKPRVEQDVARQAQLLLAGLLCPADGVVQEVYFNTRFFERPALP